MTLIPLSTRPTRPTEPAGPVADQQTGARPPGRRLGVLLVLLLAVLGGAAYVYLPMLGVDVPSVDLARLGELSADTGLPLAALLAVPAGAAMLLLLVAVRRSRRGVVPEDTSDDSDSVVAEVEEAAGPEPRPRRRSSLRHRARAADSVDHLDTDTPPAGRIPEDLVPEMDPRALLLYARSLEGTLHDQEDRLEQVRRAADERHRVALELDHVKVRATVDLMRRVQAHQPGVVALGRTEAAVARLGVEPGFARPLLPSGPAGTIPVTFGTAPAPEPTQHGADAGPAPEPTTSVAVSGSLVEREAALSAEPTPVELTAAGRPKVRPVPPPPETSPTRRGRLRRRGPRS